VSRKIKLLIDECLHTSLVQVATARDYEAYHVVYLGMGGLKDHELMPKIRAGEYTFVTNNAIDFRRLFKTEILHCGLVIIVPNVTPAIQRQLLDTVLDYIGTRDLMNTALEIDLVRTGTEIKEYEIPSETLATN
jgi:predicted nuclease of predicted toxin-antitoxin system